MYAVVLLQAAEQARGLPPGRQATAFGSIHIGGKLADTLVVLAPHDDTDTQAPPPPP